MTEYFIKANSFAAPIFSDGSEAFVEAATPEEALEKFVASYKHPAGLYAAFAYRDANAFAKDKNPLARWLCNHAIEKEKLTADLGGYSFLGHGPGDFEIDGKRHQVADPKGGRVVAI